MADRHPAWAKIEPGALEIVGVRDEALGPREHAIELSKAISLKNMFTMPLNAFGENIGTAISGQIVRAMRGDDR